jgi:uncharacterized protein DUF6210
MKESKTMRVVPEPPRKTTFYVPQEGLILKHPTGVWWQGQAGGMACTHPEAEGVFIPLDVYDGISDALHEHCCWDTSLAKAQEIAVTRISKCLSEHLPFLHVDADFLADSTEAWLHVRIDAAKIHDGLGQWTFNFIDPKDDKWQNAGKAQWPFDRAVLVCTNCD